MQQLVIPKASEYSNRSNQSNLAQSHFAAIRSSALKKNSAGGILDFLFNASYQPGFFCFVSVVFSCSLIFVFWGCLFPVRVLLLSGAL